MLVSYSTNEAEGAVGVDVLNEKQILYEQWV